MPVSTIDAKTYTVPQEEQLDFIDQVMRQSEAALLAGSALDIDPAALADLMTRLRPEVVKQLTGPDLLSKQEKWFDDSKNVLLAANMLGMIATCVARLNHQASVDNDALGKAFALVKQECGGRFGPQGCYCGCS
jgi:hypothetical protein